VSYHQGLTRLRKEEAGGYGLIAWKRGKLGTPQTQPPTQPHTQNTHLGITEVAAWGLWHRALRGVVQEGVVILLAALVGIKAVGVGAGSLEDRRALQLHQYMSRLA